MENNNGLIDKKRKLASVQKIDNIAEIKKMKNIECAKVLGYNVGVQKNQFKIGDKIIFFEVDSKLPVDEKWSKFLENNNFEVKAKKFGKLISQGLILPLSILDEHSEKIDKNNLEIGCDLTKILKVTKFNNDADLPLKSEKIKKEDFNEKFPIHLIEKTDEERIQSVPDFIEKFKGKNFYSSLKYDGTSGTYVIDPKTNIFYICSRNLNRPYDKKDIYSQIADKYDIKNKLIKNECRYAIQGEIYGKGIQKNPFKINEIKIAVFTIRDIIKNKYLDFEELKETCKILDLPMVEVIEEGIFNYTIEELIEKSKGDYPNTNHKREGLVYRIKENWNDGNERFSFKVINNEYIINN